MVQHPYTSMHEESRRLDEGAEAARRDPVDAARHIPELVDELREYIAFYTAARKDLAGAKVRAGLVKAILGALAGIAGSAAIFVSVGLLLTGLAQGLGWLFGGRFWLGYSVLGATLLILAGLGAWIFVRHWRKTSRDETIRRYEDKKQVQQLRFHRNVEELASHKP